MYNTKLYWDGEVPRTQSRDKLIEWLKQYPPDTWFEMELWPIGDINTTAQSKLYFKWCDIIASEYGWNNKDEAHDFFKMTFIGTKGSTKGFSTKQWSEYMNKVLAWASENNIILPTGNS